MPTALRTMSVGLLHSNSFMDMKETHTLGCHPCSIDFMLTGSSSYRDVSEGNQFSHQANAAHHVASVAQDP